MPSIESFIGVDAVMVVSVFRNRPSNWGFQQLEGQALPGTKITLDLPPTGSPITKEHIKPKE
jgi:hypothetical protein